jgi:hypothetical protein
VEYSILVKIHPRQMARGKKRRALTTTTRAPEELFQQIQIKEATCYQQNRTGPPIIPNTDWIRNADHFSHQLLCKYLQDDEDEEVDEEDDASNLANLLSLRSTRLIHS